VDESCADVIVIGDPSYPPPGMVTDPGVCFHKTEVNTSLDPHRITNLDTYMSWIDGANYVSDELAVTDHLDHSVRCGSNATASIGNYPNTTPWPALSPAGNHGASRVRGYLHIPEGGDLNRTVGLIGNDALRLTIEGQTIIEVWWSSGQWKKFRHVSFPAPGLYAVEVEWSTNFICGIDPFEVVWGTELIAGYGAFDTMCASSNCGQFGDGNPIPGLEIITGTEFVRSPDGGPLTCAECSVDGDCASGACGPAGICE
jgi:hypothetical protein